MAFISKNNIKKIDKDRFFIHEEVRATYSIFDVDGKRYFQLDTYGKQGRQNKDSISQSLQLDEESAKTLIALIAKTFEW